MDALRRSQMLLRASIESQKDTLFLAIDKNFNYLFFNKVHADAMMINCHREIKEGNNFLDYFISEEDKNMAKEDFSRALAGESFTNIRAFGEPDPVYYEGYFHPITGDQNEILGATMLGRDVTKRVLGLKDLVKAKDELQRFFSLVPALVVVASSDGYFLNLNPEWEKTLGYSRAELLSQPYESFIHPDDIGPTREEVMRQINGGMTIHFENRYRHKDGSYRWLEWYATPVADNQLYAAARDVTDRREMEIELRRAKEKAEESDRLKSAFLANMSHEIRTPMNGILGFTEILSEPGIPAEDQARYIRIIQKSGNRLLNIINDIVDIAKIESGQMEVRQSFQNLNEKIEYLYNFFLPEALQKGLEFQFVTGLPAEEAGVVSDHEKILAIMINLIKNALKFTNSGNIRFGYNRKEELIEFFVSDTGHGIRDDLKELIFERFRQGDKLTDKNYKGTGLGLAISKAYTEMLGGTIRVESAISKGSTFYFTIPYLATPDVQPALVQEIIQPKFTSSMKKFKILIAEDDEITTAFLKNAVKEISTEIIHAAAGAEVVEICRNRPDIDIILMDIRMPSMDGYEVTRQIRLFNSRVIIIAQTAFALTGDRDKAINAGCNDYIAKPMTKEKLMNVINLSVSQATHLT